MRHHHTVARRLFIATEAAATAGAAYGALLGVMAAWQLAAELPTPLRLLAVGLPAGIALRLVRQVPVVVSTLRRWHGAAVRRLSGRWLFPRTRRVVLRGQDWLTASWRTARRAWLWLVGLSRKAKPTRRAERANASGSEAERAEAEPGEAKRTQVAEKAKESAEIYSQGGSRSQGATCDNNGRATGRFVRQDEAQRFWSKVDKTSHPGGCWLWTGAVDDDGYGRFRVTLAPGRYRHVKAHRWSYEQAHGPIPDGLTLDHLDDICGNPACVRPDHLDPVPLAVNIARAAQHRRTKNERSPK